MSEEPFGKAKAIRECAVIIVGGTSGVGLAAARQFVDAGARGVALIGRNLQRGERAVAAVRETSPGAKVVFSQGDSVDVASAATAFERAREALGGVDVLINTTAASYVPKLLFRTELADIEPMLVQQALAPMIMSRLAFHTCANRRAA